MIRQAVRWEIVKRINSQYEALISRKREELSRIPGVAEQVYKSIVTDEEYEVAAKLNEFNAWVPKISSLSVLIQYMSFNNERKSRVFTVYFKKPLYASRSFFNMHNYKKARVLESLPCYQDCVNVCIEIDKLEDEEKRVQDEIQAAFEACSTVRQLIEIWPSVIDYLPQDELNKLRPTTRKVKSKIDFQFSDEVKVALIKLRLVWSKK